jgi:hypothetical protein
MNKIIFSVDFSLLSRLYMVVPHPEMLVYFGVIGVFHSFFLSVDFSARRGV